MKKYSVSELRELYLSFFESKGHLRLKSFSLIPNNDNSLLLINSGMAPLKPYFTGQEIPPRKRVTTCQKCIRTGDIDNIGHTARHGTFFEMLGNFSFGDYFKKEAITWSWEFLTEVLELDKNRLYPSVYIDDIEAYDLWHDYIGIPSDKIYKFGKEDNFWEHGSGPCGPCSEIYYDRGKKYGCQKLDCKVGCDCDRFMEVWNNVFTQFNSDGKGNYTELEHKNIDTGMGLERLAVVVQDVESIFEVDTNKELMDAISLKFGHLYKEDENIDISFRIIADHIKSCTFMISDGILPSNEGRGYVLRRLLRRAVQHGRKLGIKKLFMSDLSEVVIKLNFSHYRELIEKKDMIKKVINNEEENFIKTLDQGLLILNEYSENLIKNNKKILSGMDAFKLYDTFGFPIDSTKEILKEKNIDVDIKEFNDLMEKQKTRARNARKQTNYMGSDATVFDTIDSSIKTEFDGYDKLNEKSKIIFIEKNNELVDEINEGDEAIIITDRTPFYPLMGGQVGDKGTITNINGVFEVYDTIKILNTKIGHVGKVISGQFNVKNEIELCVNKTLRHKTAINHTATHLLHAALREVLGKHIEQAGSLVDSEKLRFDFTHFSPMTQDEIKKVEDLVNLKINESISIIKKEMPIEEAKKQGAIALFGEKYSNIVRTIKISDFSFELCGGTHIDNTLEIRYFKIISEESVAMGIRRIVAITDDTVINYYNEKYNKLIEIEKLLKANDNSLIDKLNQIISELKQNKLELEKYKKEKNDSEITDIKIKNINGLNVLIDVFENKNINELKEIADNIKEKNSNYFQILIGIKNDIPSILVSISDEAVKLGYNANNIIKSLAPLICGSGGGKEKFAQAGGKNIENINQLLDEANKILK